MRIVSIYKCSRNNYAYLKYIYKLLSINITYTNDYRTKLA